MSERVTVMLDADLVEHVRAAVACGDYRSEGEVIAAALQLWRQQAAVAHGDVLRLRSLIAEADAQPHGTDMDLEEAFALLEARYAPDATSQDDTNRRQAPR